MLKNITHNILARIILSLLKVKSLLVLNRKSRPQKFFAAIELFRQLTSWKTEDCQN